MYLNNVASITACGKVLGRLVVDETTSIIHRYLEATLGLVILDSVRFEGSFSQRKFEMTFWA